VSIVSGKDVTLNDGRATWFGHGVTSAISAIRVMTAAGPV